MRLTKDMASNMKSKIGVLLMVAGLNVFLSGCQGDDRLKEVSAKETEGQIEVENRLAREMEEDLRSRQKFYTGVSGIYEGQAISQSGAIYKLRIKLIPSLPPYTVDRTRMREEIAADLNNLFFNVQVLMWSPESKVGAVGFVETGVRPNLEDGTISVASETGTYTIKIHDQPMINGKIEGKSVESSQRIARMLINGRATRINAIYGEIQPKSSTEALVFNAEHVLESK